MVLIGSTLRLSDSVREGERLKGQIEEKDREIVVLMRRLEVRGFSFLIVTHTVVHFEFILHSFSCRRKCSLFLQMCINPHLKIVPNKFTIYSCLSYICQKIEPTFYPYWKMKLCNLDMFTCLQ